MKTYPLNEARAAFSKVMDEALAGEPQRITRHGKDAVIVISEAAWQARVKPKTLADLFLETVGEGFETVRPWKRPGRPLGQDFVD